MTRLTANLGLLLAAAIWGGGFVAQSDAMAHLGGAWFTGLRYILAFAVVLPLGLVEARRAARPIALGQLMLLLPLGLVFFAGTILQQWAMASTSVTHVGFLTALYVIFVPVLEMVILRRRPHPAIWLAAVVALSGTWFLAGNFSAFSPGDLMTILAALCFAFQIIILNRFVAVTHRPALAALAQSLSCVLFGCMIGAATGPVYWPALRAAGAEMLYAGILSGGIAFLLQAICQRYTRATDAAVMLMSESLFAALFAALLLGESLPARGWFGCFLLVVSLLLAQFGPALLSERGRQKMA